MTPVHTKRKLSSFLSEAMITLIKSSKGSTKNAHFWILNIIKYYQMDSNITLKYKNDSDFIIEI